MTGMTFWVTLAGTDLHLANVGALVVEALEQRSDIEKAPHPVVNDVSDTFA